MTVLEKIDSYLAARTEYERIHEESQKAHAAMRATEYELVDGMLNDGVPSIGLDTGVHVSLRKQFQCSVTQANEDQVREWLTETCGDDSQFVIEKVNKPALLEWLKARFEKAEMDEDSVPSMLKLSTRPGITLRGWKNRK